MKRNIALAAVAAFTLSACSGLKDALNAHTDWVARAGSAELMVTKLGNLLGKSRAPIRKDIAKSIANVWVDYQLLGSRGAQRFAQRSQADRRSDVARDRQSQSKEVV